MTYEDLTHRDSFAEFRDPLSAEVGYHFGDDNGCAPCRFKWFESVGDLIDHILNVELPLCSYDRDMHDDFRERLGDVLGKVATKDLTEETRDALNKIDWGFTVYWWGTLHDLMSGQSQFSREMLGSFAVKKGGGCGIVNADMPAFLEFLRVTCGSDFDANQTCANDDLPTEDFNPYLQNSAPRH